MKGRIDVRCDRRDATGEVDGARGGRCGTTVDLPVGRHQVRIRSGAALKEKAALVRVGATEIIEVTFDPPRLVAATLVPPKVALTRVEIPLKRAPPAPGRTRKATGWSLIGAGGATLIAGIVLAARASSQATTKENENLRLAGTNTTADMAALARLGNTGTGLIVGGGIMGIAGAVVLLIGKPARQSAGRTSLDFGVVAGAHGALGPAAVARWDF